MLQTNLNIDRLDLFYLGQVNSATKTETWTGTGTGNYSFNTTSLYFAFSTMVLEDRIPLGTLSIVF